MPSSELVQRLLSVEVCLSRGHLSLELTTPSPSKSSVCSQASPRGLLFEFAWSGFGTSGQLSPGALTPISGTPSLSSSVSQMSPPLASSAAVNGAEPVVSNRWAPSPSESKLIGLAVFGQKSMLSHRPSPSVSPPVLHALITTILGCRMTTCGSSLLASLQPESMTADAAVATISRNFILFASIMLLPY